MQIVCNYTMQVYAVLCGVVFWSGLLAQEVRLQDDSRLQEALAIQKPFAPLRAVLRTVQEATGVPLRAYRASPQFVGAASWFPTRLAALLCRGRLAAGLYPAG